ncbi:MAG: TonB-dependent receptor [gamma proteobacterium symbiont of Lucinoma myriamae]|nr:TonB-dependent receptor [gamma proteobacterium symbiont of Lucinoma myriamae]
MMKKLPVLISTSALAISFYPIITQADSKDDNAQIIVTANRTANTIDETLVPATIITRDDIERLQVNSVIDILATSPGIDISSNGGFGGNQSIYMRGTNSNQVLVLIDGIPSGSATVGTTPFQFLPVSQIERVEIVRGPHSSLYGNSAIGGVIQIFTRKDQEGQHVYTNVGYGSDNTREVNLGFSNSSQKTSYNLGVSYIDSDGYNVLGDTYPDSDDDVYDNTAVSLGGRHRLTDQLELSGTFLYSEGSSDYDGNNYKHSRIDYKEQVASVIADYEINDGWLTQIQIGQSVDDQKTHRTATTKSKFKTTKNSVSWKNEFLVRETDLFTAGIDYLDESVDSSTDFSKDSRWNQAAFAQYQYYGDVFDIKLSWRYDDNEAFGSHTTGNLAIGFDLDQYVRVTTSYGSAFKAPDFNSLYWPKESFPAWFYSYEGNPDLKPEESESFEFGLSGEFHSVNWTAHYYRTKVTNLISTQGQLNLATFFWEERPENIDKATIDGIELTLNTNILGWQVQTHYSHTNPTDDDTGEILPNRSEDQFRLDVDQKKGKLSYGASVLATSERYTSSKQQMSGYGIMNIRGAWNINSHWTLKAKIDNLFDKEYATTQSYTGLPYQAQDRFAFASIHYQM